MRHGRANGTTGWRMATDCAIFTDAYWMVVTIATTMQIGTDLIQVIDWCRGTKLKKREIRWKHDKTLRFESEQLVWTTSWTPSSSTLTDPYLLLPLRTCVWAVSAVISIFVQWQTTKLVSRHMSQQAADAAFISQLHRYQLKISAPSLNAFKVD